MTLTSVEVIFDFVGAICSGACSLLFPGVGYLMALQKYGSARKRAKCSTTCDRITAWIYIFAFVLVLFLFFYRKFADLTGEDDEDQQ